MTLIPDEEYSGLDGNDYAENAYYHYDCDSYDIRVGILQYPTKWSVYNGPLVRRFL